MISSRPTIRSGSSGRPSALDLKSWLSEIKAVEGHVGRDATDPRLLVGLWVFATLKGIGSARELARLCEECLPYQWLCGGVSINYHMLSDFRSQGGEKWDELLTQIVATLLDAGLVKMDRVAQDGMRVRASLARARFIAAVRWRSVCKRRESRSRPSSNWPRRTQQS